MRVLAALVMLLSAGAMLAQELTVAEVVAAHRAGAPEDGILRLIAEAPAVATPTTADLARLREAGVPKRVIEAMVTRAKPTPIPTAVRPDDARLVDVVEEVRAGHSDGSIVERVRRSGLRYALTVNDLVYLKENQVPDAVIAAILQSNGPPSPAPTVAVAPAATATPAMLLAPFGPLLRMAGVFRKTSKGNLVVMKDRLEWHDADSPALDSSRPVTEIRAVWLRSQPRGGRDAVSELCIRTTAGEELAYRDVDWASGGEAQVIGLLRAIREHFPQLILVERPRR